MNTNEIVREAAEKMRHDGAIHAFTEQSYVEEQFRSAITRATEADRREHNRELHELLDTLKAPVGSSENGHPMGASVRERIVMLFTQSRAAPASTEQRHCKHHWRRVIPIEQEQCSICKAFRYPQCNHSQPQKERTGGK